jgi:hypothetical protein
MFACPTLKRQLSGSNKSNRSCEARRWSGIFAFLFLPPSGKEDIPTAVIRVILCVWPHVNVGNPDSRVELNGGWHLELTIHHDSASFLVPPHSTDPIHLHPARPRISTSQPLSAVPFAKHHKDSITMRSHSRVPGGRRRKTAGTRWTSNKYTTPSASVRMLLTLT